MCPPGGGAERSLHQSGVPAGAGGLPQRPRPHQVLRGKQEARLPGEPVWDGIPRLALVGDF